jgi:hypothetical protein
MIYSARFDTMNALLGYLTDHCCDGRPERCRPAPQGAPRRSGMRKKERVS